MAAQYKVTAIKDVTVRAYVHGTKPKNIGGHVVMVPDSREQWISLRAGEAREGLGLVVAVHPRCCPDKTPIHIEGVPMIILESWSNSDLPKEFLGLFRLEKQSAG